MILKINTSLFVQFRFAFILLTPKYMVVDLNNKPKRKAKESNSDNSLFKSFFHMKVSVNPSEITTNPFNLNSIPLYHDQQK